MTIALRPVAAPVPPAHRWNRWESRRRTLVQDLVAGLRGNTLRLA